MAEVGGSSFDPGKPKPQDSGGSLVGRQKLKEIEREERNGTTTTNWCVRNIFFFASRNNKFPNKQKIPV